MDTISSIRPDFVEVETASRPTATPARVPFAEVLAGGARAFIQSAQVAMATLPASPVIAAALRGSATSPLGAGVGLSADPASQLSSSAPEGPGGSASAAATMAGLGQLVGTGTGSTGSIESSLAQSQQLNLYYLQLQQAVNNQSQTFTALSNVLEVENSTAKSAISNIH